MAKLPTFRRFTIEDFQSQKSWINKLFYPLNNFLATTVTALSNGLTFAENLDAQVANLTVSTALTLTEGTAYKTTTSQTFVDANVTVASDSIAITAHPFATGDRIRFSSTGTLPGGLNATSDFYVVKIDANTIKPAASLADAFASTIVNITSAAGGGTHTVAKWAQLPAYAKLLSAPQIMVKTQAVPQGLEVWSCRELATNPTVLRYGVFCDWSYANGSITINSISGLEPAKTYNLVLLISGG